MRTCTDNTLCWWRASDHLFCEACRRYVYNYLTFFKAAHYPIGRMMTPSPSMLTSATWLDSIKIPHVLTWWSVIKGIHNRDSREIPNFHDTLYDFPARISSALSESRGCALHSPKSLARCPLKVALYSYNSVTCAVPMTSYYTTRSKTMAYWDAPLTSVGEAQGEALAEKVATLKVPPELVVVSPLRRVRLLPCSFRYILLLCKGGWLLISCLSLNVFIYACSQCRRFTTVSFAF